MAPGFKKNLVSLRTKANLEFHVNISSSTPRQVQVQRYLVCYIHCLTFQRVI